MGSKLFAGVDAFNSVKKMRGIFSRSKPPTSPTRREVSAAGTVLRAVPSPSHWNRSLGPEAPAKKPPPSVRKKLAANLRKGKKARKKGSKRKAPAHLRKYQFKKGGGRASSKRSSPKRAKKRSSRKGRAPAHLRKYQFKKGGGRAASKRAKKSGSAPKRAPISAAEKLRRAESMRRRAAIKKRVRAEVAEHRLPEIAVRRRIARAIRDDEEASLLAKYGGTPAAPRHSDEDALAAKYG
jgi:hypothetical protein